MMNLEESLSKGFNYTRRLFARVKDLLILTLINLIPIVNILTLGYAGRVTRDSPASEGPPKLERWWGMFVDGLKAVCAVILWAIPIAIVAVLLMMAFLIPTIGFLAITSPEFWTEWGLNFANSTAGNWTHIGQFMQRAFEPLRPLALAIIPALLLIGLAVLFSMVMAFTGIVHMFKKGSFWKAFAVGEIFSIMGKIGYLRYFGLVFVALLMGGVIGILSRIPVLGWLIQGFLGMLLIIAIFRTIGLLYDDAMGISEAPLVSQAPPAAPLPTAPVATENTPSAAAAETKEAKQTKTKQLYCVSCGTANPFEGKFCRNCGKELVKS
jgi:ribosomal protein L40E